MTGVMAICSVAALVIYSFGFKKTLQPATVELVEEEEVDMINTL